MHKTILMLIVGMGCGLCCTAYATSVPNQNQSRVSGATCDGTKEFLFSKDFFGMPESSDAPLSYRTNTCFFKLVSPRFVASFNSNVPSYTSWDYTFTRIALTAPGFSFRDTNQMFKACADATEYGANRQPFPQYYLPSYKTYSRTGSHDGGTCRVLYCAVLPDVQKLDDVASRENISRLTTLDCRYCASVKEGSVVAPTLCAAQVASVERYKIELKNSLGGNLQKLFASVLQVGGDSSVSVPETSTSLIQPIQSDASQLISSDESVSLQKGSKGSDVKKLQTLLGITSDGVFGKQTQAAVTSFQVRNGISPTGIADQTTLRTLKASNDKMLYGVYNSAQYVTIPSVPVFTTLPLIRTNSTTDSRLTTLIKQISGLF